MNEEENKQRLLKYLEKVMKENVSSKNLFDKISEKDKLRKRCEVSNHLKKAGRDIPPDNIDIKD